MFQYAKFKRRESKITIDPVFVNNSGIYTCYGLYEEGAHHFLAMTYLNVFGEFLQMGRL